MSPLRERLGRTFFARYTPEVAQDLLGCLLVRRVDLNLASGIIVEVEAYRGTDDPASHAHIGPTKRNAVMFGEAGRAYVYFIYGNHYCLNFTTEREGRPGAVLIRALEPVDGIEGMAKRRKTGDARELTSGPGKLARALSVDLSLNGEDLVRSDRLWVMQREKRPEIASSVRIGVVRGRRRMWRYFVPGNEYVSVTDGN